ncbi:MgtC/SapB family protein [Marinobacter zhanjiangensis]|uniref:Membrane protein n=1 Tax=Marinobacter zhanjiangensis TaxID=578215 RepID=A0ABQ3B894_9GAMM|nr:MgtC/SapB family protein [Marinobacter zhanjiangensis]GGY84357.1 membrane protein [Marinobacter zhanjiangensis]
MDDIASSFLENNEVAIQLAVALLLGALIGLERGWEARHKEAGERIAGIRTHALTGLLGAIAALLSQTLTFWVFPVVFLGLIGVTLVSYHARTAETRNYSITGIIGLLLTFCFGTMVIAVDMALAAASAVITALILDNKAEIHGALNRLKSHELDAALKLLLITVVMLPLLPNQGMGPGDVLNPYQIWWMVVLIASISFVGYFAIRVGGAEKGILFTSLFAGLSSSTALTLHFSRQSRQAGMLTPMYAAGILIACGTMFPRILIYGAIINRALLPALVWPVTTMAVVLYLGAGLIWLRNRRDIRVEQPELSQNPLDLKSALVFGILLTVILVLGEWLQQWLGDLGIYVLAATSGITDVDAITLSLTRMSVDDIGAGTAVLGIVIAASVNNLVKSTMAATIGTRHLGLLVGVPMALSLAVGLAVAWAVNLGG